MKITLVGECNPYGGDPQFALYPAPDGCSGHRLCCLILGMGRKDYLETFERVNLCVDKWSLPAARASATNIILERLGHCRLILLGSKVCQAFGVPFVPFTVADEIMLRLPHPSGLCRLWDEAGAVQKARSAVAAFAPEMAALLGGPQPTNRIDLSDAAANMFGIFPCPKCGDKCRWPTRPDHKTHPSAILCDRCGLVEPLPEEGSP